MKTIKSMFKAMFVAGLLAFSISSAEAKFTLTFVVNALTATNIFSNFQNPVLVSQASVASATSSQGIVTLYDTTTNVPSTTGYPLWSYQVPAYTNIISYVTNYYVFYTNFYGTTQYSYTNKALIDVTNSVPLSTNYFNSPLFLSAPTNTTVTFTSISAVFNYGIWATNSGTGPATITLTYQ